jgi:ATP-dependent Lon protease
LSCKTRVKKRYQSKVRFDLDQQQREYFLQQQMKTIQEELGGNTQEEEIDEMLVKAKDKKWDEKPKAFRKELSKMRRMNPQALILGFKEII